MPIYETSDGRQFESEEPLTEAQIARLMGSPVPGTTASPAPKRQPVTASRAAGAIGSGFNEELANFLGIPGDLAQSALRYAERKVRDFGKAEPFQDPMTGEMVTARRGAPTPEEDLLFGGDSMLGSAGAKAAMEAVGLSPQAPRDMPPEVRPWGYGGAVLGAGAPIAAAPFALAARVPNAAQKGETALQTARMARPTAAALEAQPALKPGIRGAAQKAGRYITRSGPKGYVSPTPVTSALARPGEVASAELAGLTSSAAGATGFSAAFGGEDAGSEEGAVFAGEVIGGMRPLAMLTSAGGSLARDGRRFLASISPGDEAKRRIAAEDIQAGLASVGEEPVDVAQAIGSGGRFGETAGQLSQSPYLIGLENTLAERAGPAMQLRQQLERTKALLDDQIQQLIDSGDPAALQAAAAMRDRYYRSLLQARRLKADEQIAEASESLRPQGTGAEASIRDKDIIESAYSDARAAERAAWEATPVRAAEPKFLQEHTRRIIDEDPDEPIPPRVRSLLARYENPKGKPITTRQLSNLRSDLGDAAEGARKDGKINTARKLSDFSEAILADLSEYSGPEFDNARAFSRELNNVFRNDFMETLIRPGRQGEPAIPPSRVLEKTMGPGGEQAALSVEAQRRAVSPIQVEGQAPVGVSRVPEISKEQETFLREMLAKTYDPATETINPNALATFRRNNRRLLSLFPDVDVENAEQVVRRAQRTIAETNRRQEAMGRMAFAKVAAVEPQAVSSVFSSALASPTAQKDVRRLLSLARRESSRAGNQEALRGAASAFAEALLQKSKRADGVAGGILDGNRMRRYLSLHRQDLINSGTFTKEQVDNLFRVSREADKVAAAVRNPDRLSDILEKPSSVMEGALSVLGANISSSAGGGSGSSLVLAERGARRMREIGLKNPIEKSEEIILEATRNPALMRDLLLMPTGRGRDLANARIKANLISAGIISPEDLGAGEEEPQE